MSRRNNQRVPARVDARGVGWLPIEEIRAILRGADAMIATGGRTLLSKLLKGSREKKLLELGLDGNPVYGFYRDLPLEQIVRRIDWTIENGYLAIHYEWRLPTLVFTDRGWDIEIETMTDELLRGFDERLAVGPPFDMNDLKDRDRGMILLLLDKIEASGRSELIPLLRAWMEIDYKKVRVRIRSVIRKLSGEEEPTE